MNGKLSTPAASATFFRRRFFAHGRPARAHPAINFSQFAFPKAADPMSRQLPLLDPAVDGIGCNAQMRRNLYYGAPPQIRRLYASWNRHRSTIVAKSRKEVKLLLRRWLAHPHLWRRRLVAATCLAEAATVARSDRLTPSESAW